MKRVFLLAIFVASGATSVAACPWADGTYSGRELNFEAKFSVNSNCTEMVFESSGSAGFQEADTPETFALSEAKTGWAAEVHGVTATLQKDGRWVDFIGSGVNTRVQFEK